MIPGTRPHALLAFGGIVAWLLMMAVVHPVSHDESQYVAATYFVAHGLLPYRDFAYLQTPLQPLVFAPLAWLFEGRLFAASRFANAVLATVSVALVYATSRKAGAAQRAALASCVLLVTCHAYLWAAGIARNDMLPTTLLATTLWLLVGSGRSWQHLVGGFAAGLAVSTKISFALPVAGAFAASISSDGNTWRNTPLALVGLVAGLVPTIAIAQSAPEAFLFEVFTFGLKAPGIWYTELGEQWALGPVRVLNLAVQAAMGPALLAIILVVRQAVRQGHEWLCEPNRRILAAAAAGGLLSAAIIRPFNTPYLVPALPPLFVLLSLTMESRGRASRGADALLVITAAIGLAFPAMWICNSVDDGGFPIAKVEHRSAKMRNLLLAEQVSGPIAWLSTHYLVDSGFPVDPRFAAGPFLFRTVGLVNASQATVWHIVTRDQLGTLASAPPAAIITGGEQNKSVKPDVELAGMATMLGFRPVARLSKFTIWTRPRSSSERPHAYANQH